MTAYIVLFRHQTHDENGMKTYADLASQTPMNGRLVNELFG